MWHIRPKLCGNCAFPQNSHSRKLGGIMVFFTVVQNVWSLGSRKSFITNKKNWDSTKNCWTSGSESLYKRRLSDWTEATIRRSSVK